MKREKWRRENVEKSGGTIESGLVPLGQPLDTPGVGGGGSAAGAFSLPDGDRPICAPGDGLDGRASGGGPSDLWSAAAGPDDLGTAFREFVGGGADFSAALPDFIYRELYEAGSKWGPAAYQ